ncbi:Bax inhibitor-1/YccA family protein [Rarobacter faecitabidus]|uniref:Putative YccA/Bax inhibitor family protein n=1 Tax=Rarobacter faecitabidus TaxID=13243 RepID=A0A542ZUG0_RARFA|nr:Bax inhibitor-1/YccA family protein [Rarobacter faecitabidus]TQL63830.1 putative YccA/Bax inhibitor family protein [Rarobacter faecitabidus]
MSNPVFSSPAYSSATQVQHFPDQSTATPTGDPSTLQSMYNAPSATPLDTNRMTYDDVIMKTAGLLVLLLATGVVSWSLVDSVPGLWLGGLVVGLVLGLVNAFKRNPSPVLIALYAAAEGLFLGGISASFNVVYDGIVLQAVLATLATFTASLLLFTSGAVRVTPKFNRFLLVAIAGYALFSLANLILVWTGVLDGWGMRGGQWGIIIGIVAVVLAAMSLISDFDSIKRGVQAGAPRKFAWAAAFGLVVTLVWLYLEFLRLLAILRN